MHENPQSSYIMHEYFGKQLRTTVICSSRWGRYIRMNTE